MIMVSIREIPVEKHPWPPFLPANARILMLGSFPPKPERWCMDFFYPNWLNDMWRIMGEIFYADKNSEKSKGRYRELWIFHRRGMPCGNGLK